MARYDETPVPRGTSRRWEVLLSDDEDRATPRAERTALDVHAEHRVLAGFDEGELAAMPLVIEGARLLRRAWYLDLHDPARADFLAEGHEVVEPGQHIVARASVSPALWDALRDGCDAVLGRRPNAGLRPAV